MTVRTSCFWRKTRGPRKSFHVDPGGVHQLRGDGEELLPHQEDEERRAEERGHDQGQEGVDPAEASSLQKPCLELADRHFGRGDRILGPPEYSRHVADEPVQALVVVEQRND